MFDLALAPLGWAQSFDLSQGAQVIVTVRTPEWDSSVTPLYVPIRANFHSYVPVGKVDETFWLPENFVFEWALKVCGKTEGDKQDPDLVHAPEVPVRYQSWQLVAVKA